jgi:hypothetical protein
MTVLKPELDAAEVGLDPARLERLDRHFARQGSPFNRSSMAG